MRFVVNICIRSRKRRVKKNFYQFARYKSSSEFSHFDAHRFPDTSAPCGECRACEISPTRLKTVQIQTVERLQARLKLVCEKVEVRSSIPFLFRFHFFRLDASCMCFKVCFLNRSDSVLFFICKIDFFF